MLDLEACHPEVAITWWGVGKIDTLRLSPKTQQYGFALPVTRAQLFPRGTVDKLGTAVLTAQARPRAAMFGDYCWREHTARPRRRDRYWNPAPSAGVRDSAAI